MAVLISWDEKSYTVRDLDPDDHWDRGDTHTEIYDIVGRWVEDVPIKSTWGNSPQINGFAPGDVCFAVVAQWSTGDTFGQDSGACVGVLGAFRDRETAEQLADEARSFRNDKSEEHLSNYELEFQGQIIHIGWTGYFESLDGIKVQEIVVRNG